MNLENWKRISWNERINGKCKRECWLEDLKLRKRESRDWNQREFDERVSIRAWKLAESGWTRI